VAVYGFTSVKEPLLPIGRLTNAGKTGNITPIAFIRNPAIENDEISFFEFVICWTSVEH
jgi:hypothetical protein